MRKIANVIKNPWTITIGSGLIIALITFLLKLVSLEDIRRLPAICKSFLTTSIEFTVWQVILLILLIPAVLLIIRTILKSKRQVGWPNYLSYTSDNIGGISWQWDDYRGYCIVTDDSLKPICPKSKCKCELSVTSRYDRNKGHIIQFTCPVCGFETYERGHSVQDVLRPVTMEIERRLRVKGFDVWPKGMVFMFLHGRVKSSTKPKSPLLSIIWSTLRNRIEDERDAANPVTGPVEQRPKPRSHRYSYPLSPVPAFCPRGEAAEMCPLWPKESASISVNLRLIKRDKISAFSPISARNSPSSFFCWLLFENMLKCAHIWPWANVTCPELSLRWA